ncbi:hypothetical protein [Desulfonatronum parangueonense]
MDLEKDKYAVPKKEGLGDVQRDYETAIGPGMEDRRAASWDKAERELGDVYEKTGKVMNKTYDRAKSYSCEKPGTTVLIALGVGVGLGFLLGASSRRSRRNEFVEPFTYALSDVVQKVLR